MAALVLILFLAPSPSGARPVHVLAVLVGFVRHGHVLSSSSGRAS